MNVTWRELVVLLGAKESSDAFNNLVNNVGEEPDVWQTPIKFNDPGGTTRFYRFFAHGVELGIRRQMLNHIRMYVSAEDEYSAYSGPLEVGVARHADEASVRAALGSPSSSGGGNASALLGFRRRWVKYSYSDYAQHYEFIPNDGLSRVTLIAE